MSEFKGHMVGKFWQMYLKELPDLQKRVAALEKLIKGPDPQDGIALAMRVMFHSS